MEHYLNEVLQYLQNAKYNLNTAKTIRSFIEIAEEQLDSAIKLLEEKIDC